MRRSAEEIRRWMTEQVGELIGLPGNAIAGDLPFSHFGLDSARIFIMLGDLADWLGVELTSSVVFDHPDIDSLARYLGGPEPGAAAEERPAPAPAVRTGVADEPIAIVGIGCRYPGHADDPRRFWRVVADGVDCVRRVPSDRWDADAFYCADPAAPGCSVSNVGGFLDNVTDFDAHFFGIAPREARTVDPQQRLLLETAWEALEDAGIPAVSLAGSRTGVFVGYCYSDFARRMAAGGLVDINPYSITGLNDCIGANRISYFLDLRGPSMVVHSASSSSLVAVHQACLSLLVGECDLAMAGGVTLALSPAVHVVYTKAGAMSPDVSRPFDASTRGMVRGEGGGVVVLRRLSAALEAGDRIYAVIRASAVTQDGRTNGLAAPSQEGIERVMQAALQRARIGASDYQYVEAHGTGTVIGDLVEGTAICRVVGAGRPADAPCRVGSIKSNFGHPEAGAGVAGLIKVALAIHHRQLPPTIHVERPNPEIPWERNHTEVQTRLTPWPRPDRPLIGGVNSLGLGGTNAHVIVGEPPPEARPARRDGDEGGRSVVLPLSARAGSALRALAERYADLLDGGEPAASLGEIAAAAALRRSPLSHRLAVVASSRAEAGRRLRAYLRGEPDDGVVQGKVSGSQRHELVFVFSGQGSQWARMGMELLAGGPEWAPFRDKLRECDRLLRGHVSWSLLEEIARPRQESSLHRTDLTQPALFCIQVALAAQWAALGVRPAAVIGHSFAEVTAAHVAGALTLEESLRLIALRSRLMHQASGLGRMVASELDPAEAEALAARTGGRVVVAAVNGPRSVTLSGELDAMAQVLRELERRAVFHRELRVSTAFHSSLMEPFRAPLVAALAGLRPRATEVPMISSVIGLEIDGRALGAEYWGRNLREPVQFAGAIEEAARLGYTSFLEVSPHPVLSAHVVDCFEASGREAPVVLPTLRQSRPEAATVHASLAALWAQGGYDGWSRFHAGGSRFVSLPTYPWQRKRWWSEPTRPWSELLPIEDQLADLAGGVTVEIPIQTEPEPAGVSPLLARLAEFGLGDDSMDRVTRESYAAAPAEARPGIVEGLLRHLCARGLGLKIEEVDPDRPLGESGLDSISVAQVRQGVRAVLGSAPSVGQFFDGSTIRTMAARLTAGRPERAGRAGGAAPEARAWLRPTARARTARFRLFCLPHAGAGALAYRPWVEEAPPEIEVLAVPLPGREDHAGEPPVARMHLLVPPLARALAPYLDRPYALFGHSLGALVAFELARELRRMGLIPPSCLFASACRAPHMLWSRASGAQGGHIHRLSDAEFVRFVSERGRLPPELVASPDALAYFLPVLRADFEVFDTYVYTEGRPLATPIMALAGHRDPLIDADELRAWAAETSRDFSQRLLPGDHFYHLEPPGRGLILLEILAELRRLDPGASSDRQARQRRGSEVAR